MGAKPESFRGSLSERAHGVIQVAEVVTLNGLGQIQSLDRLLGRYEVIDPGRVRA